MRNIKLAGGAYLFRDIVVRKIVFRENRVGHDEQIVVGRRIGKRRYVVERQIRDGFTVHVLVEVHVVIRVFVFGSRVDDGRRTDDVVLPARPFRFRRRNVHRRGSGGGPVARVRIVAVAAAAVASRRQLRRVRLRRDARDEIRLGRRRRRRLRLFNILATAAVVRHGLPQLRDFHLLLPDHRVPFAQQPSDLLLLLPQPRLEHVQRSQHLAQVVAASPPPLPQLIRFPVRSQRQFGRDLLPFHDLPAERALRSGQLVFQSDYDIVVVSLKQKKQHRSIIVR